MTATGVLLRGEYGFDAGLGGVVRIVAIVAASLAAAIGLELDRLTLGAAVSAVVAIYAGSMLAIYLHTTRRGKFIVWREILDALSLRGDESVLDVGCGRGAVMVLVAQRLSTGRVDGVDLWIEKDQSGNSLGSAERNLVAEGVRGRCTLRTADMRMMPFASQSYDLVVSSLAIHNVRERGGRADALSEIARVVRPGGRVALADLAWTESYAKELARHGFVDIKRRHLGWRFWWGPLFPRTILVTAVKPARGETLDK